MVHHQRDRKVGEKECQKIAFETHGGNPTRKTKTLCGGIVYVQPHVSIKRDKPPCEKQQKASLVKKKKTACVGEV